MGGQLYTVFRPSVPEAQPPDDVRALYLHLDEADRLAREIGVTPLGNFLSAAVEGPIEAWFSLEDGLRTVKGLATAIRERPREPGNWAYNIDHEFAALEPYVRRIWPFGLMGWTRLFSGHYRDPLVGRDLLAGAAAGSFMAMAAPVRDVASRLLEGGAPMPVANGLAGLLGFRYSVVTTINILLTSINKRVSRRALIRPSLDGRPPSLARARDNGSAASLDGAGTNRKRVVRGIPVLVLHRRNGSVRSLAFRSACDDYSALFRDGAPPESVYAEPLGLVCGADARRARNTFVDHGLRLRELACGRAPLRPYAPPRLDGLVTIGVTT